MVTTETTIVAVGDVHGELEALREILRHARILGRWDQWIGGETVLVQTGDMIDRGPRSREAYALLEKLQLEALDVGGRVIRLIGNHELAVLQGNEEWTNFPNVAGFRQVLARDVLTGRVQGAHAGQGYLFTHAGVRSEMIEHLLKGKAVENSSSVEVLAASINRTLNDAVKTGDFSDPVFRIGDRRGGEHPIGGIFWEDASGMMGSLRAGTISQVFGHTPHREIQISRSGSRVIIDVGIHCYEGRAYLLLHGGKPIPRQVR